MSYTWGAPDFSHYLFCDGAVVMITANVDSLLRNMRKKTSSRYLWIDAVCLNQQDKLEKNQQIPLMGEIYHHSRKVYIWLGESTETTRRALVFLQAIVTLPRTGDIREAVMKTIQIYFPCGTVSPIQEFLYNAWFSRRWVLQEAASGRVVTAHCGSVTVLWYCNLQIYLH
jgi:hypothetical protein